MPVGKKDENGSACKRAPEPGTVRGRRSVNTLFKSGRRLVGKQVTLIYRNLPDGNTRYSVFVPKRLGGSVRRNRARRVLREFIRTNQRPALTGKETIILCRQTINRSSIKEAKEELGRMLDRLAAK